MKFVIRVVTIWRFSWIDDGVLNTRHEKASFQYVLLYYLSCFFCKSAGRGEKTNALVLYCSIKPASSFQELIVRSTSTGDVRGFTVPLNPTNNTDTRQLDAFVGIPYAQPPVGALRWRNPLPVQPWQETLNATEFGACCSQNLSVIQEYNKNNSTFYA